MNLIWDSDFFVVVEVHIPSSESEKNFFLFLLGTISKKKMQTKITLKVLFARQEKEKEIYGLFV